MSDKTNYSIEFPDDLRKKVEADAEKNGRSLADHIRYVLLQSVTKSKTKDQSDGK